MAGSKTTQSQMGLREDCSD